MKNGAFVLLLLIMTSVSCLKSKDKGQVCDYDPCAKVAPNTEIAKVESYLTKNNITDAIKHCSGMYYRILEPGTGSAPGICSQVTIRYKGELTNGTVFDHTDEATNETRAFLLMELIKGWQNGLPLIKAGGTIQLFIPPSLGYGATANGNIPGNSVLIFEVSLVNVR